MIPKPINFQFLLQEFDMIGLFGSAAGRAIVNKQQQQSQQYPATPFKSNNHLTHKKNLSKMTAKSKSLDYETHVNGEHSNSPKIQEKKSKFWKLFESEKIKNSLEDISTTSSKNR